MEKFNIREWNNPPKKFLLEAGQAHVWRIDLRTLGQDLNLYEDVLSEVEFSKAQKFYFQADRIRYACTRATTRRILGKYLHIAPGNLVFGYNQYGKPHLDDMKLERNLDFNISHAGNISLLAVVKDRRIGVDLEKVHNDDSLNTIAKRFFTPDEFERLILLPDALRPEAFFTCWTRKEAFIKARGEGLTIPLDQFAVTFSPDEIPGVTYNRYTPEESELWEMYHLEPDEGYVGALVVEGTSLDVVGWDWRLESE